jgi:subtilisin family serine protease
MCTGEFLLPEELRLAIDHAVNKGRDGKGCVILFAAGNSNENIDRQGLPSYSKVITVAACNDRSERSAYSSYGKAIWCCFPSNDSAERAPLTKGIWTIDRRAGQGYNKGSSHSRAGYQTGEYTSDFGGTSASCPGAAGVAALVLSCYPNLKWYEVKDLLKDSCDKIDSARGQYDKTTGHSIFYGYGRLNAARAVERAVEMKRDYDELYA